MSLFVLLLLSILPRDDALRESVDLVEVSHFYDESGRLVFDQLIAYDWKATARTEARYQVRAWRLIKFPDQIPVRDFESGGYKVQWYDGDHYRVIFAKHFRETWLQYDVELVEREIFPKELRRELRQPRPRVQSRP